MKAIVLGGGFVGSIIAKDLAQDKDFQVSVVDQSERVLNKLASEANIKGIIGDLANADNIKKLVADQDIVLGAVPEVMGFNMLKAVVEAGKNIADVSAAPENQLDLDDLAKKHNVTAVVEMGVAPGMSNLLVGYVDSLLDKTERVSILVGGLPVVREWPYEYMLVFSLRGVIGEYLTPARIVECGKLIEKPALSDIELIDFPNIGTLEAFYTDGLGSLVYTVKAPFMKEKTLRYPGHAEKMRMLRETGFFGSEPIEVEGSKVKPLDLTIKLLFPKWERKNGERDFTIMRINVEGEKDNKRLRYTYDLLSYFDEKTNTTSMARTTGLPCAIVGRLIAKGEYSRKGICPPEYVLSLIHI